MSCELQVLGRVRCGGWGVAGLMRRSWCGRCDVAGLVRRGRRTGSDLTNLVFERILAPGFCPPGIQGSWLTELRSP